jgi:hypothetical protein
MRSCRSIPRYQQLPTVESAATDEVYRLIMAGWGSQVVRSRRLGDPMVFGRHKSNDDKPRVGDIANTCKFGRMTLPVYGGARADWTRSHRRRRNTSFALSPGRLHVKGHRMTSRQSIIGDFQLPTVEAAATAPRPDKGGR